jgi:ribosome-associated protein
LAAAAAAAAAGKLGRDIVAFDVTSRLPLIDVFVIVTGATDRQVGAIVEAVEERLLAAGAKPAGREGGQEARWVLLDFGDLVVHVQTPETRALFALDRLWSDCPRLPVGG